MDWAQIIQLLVTLFSAAAAILAWIAKLKWSQEYTTAKEAEVKAKDAQIDSLNAQIQFWKSITPPELTKYFESVKEGLQKYIQDLKAQLEEAKKKLAEKERKLAAGRGTTLTGRGDLHPIQKLMEIIRTQEQQLEQTSTNPFTQLLSRQAASLYEAQAASNKLTKLLGVQKVTLPNEFLIKLDPTVKVVKKGLRKKNNSLERSKRK
jgi:hypothetical protein